MRGKINDAITAAFVALLVEFWMNPVFAQAGGDWGDLAGADTFLEWATHSLMVKVVAIALLIAIIVGLVKWSLEWALGAFLVICVLAGIVGQVPAISEALVGS